MKDDIYFRRTTGLLRPEILRSKRVINIGAGSGGSRVDEELGRVGVELWLVDRPDEVLEEHNIIRHVLGYESLGRPKNWEMARHIGNLNPSARVHPIDMDVANSAEDFARLVDEVNPHLLLASTDNLESKFVIDQVARSRGIPVVGAAVYDGGVGGEVYITRPGEACYGCISAHLRIEDARPHQKRSIDYNNLDVDEIRSTCALNLDIAQVALLHSRISLQLLMGEQADLVSLPPETNLVVFANRRIPGVMDQSLSAAFFHLARRPECLLCAPRSVPDADSVLPADVAELLGEAIPEDART